MKLGADIWTYEREDVRESHKLSILCYLSSTPSTHALDNANPQRVQPDSAA